MKSHIFIICLVILACMLVSPALAETVNGTLGESSIVNVNYASWGSGTGGGKLTGIVVREPPAVSNTVTAIIHWPTGTVCSPADANAPYGAAQSVTLHRTNKTGEQVGTGTVGYQQIYTNAVPPVITGCYVWLTIDPGLQLGTIPEDDPANHYSTLYFGNEYGTTGLYNLSVNSGTNYIVQMPYGSAVIETVGGRLFGAYMNNQDRSAYATYTATKPSGIGIAGTVYKNYNGVNYTTRGYVLDSAGNIITSEGLASQNPFYFTTNASQIKIGMTANSLFYNSSLLFQSATPTPTPTPTPTVPPLDYTLALNKTAVSYGGAILATIASSSDPSLAHVNGIVYDYYTPTDPINVKNFKESGSTDNVSNYYKVGATWKGYQYSTNAWSNTKAAIPNPYILTFVDGTGVIDVHALINTDTGDNIDINIPVTVGSGSFITTTFQAYDGSNYGFLQSATINVLNLNTNVWTNGSYYSGKVAITTPPNQILSAYGTKPGYYPAKYENAVADGTPYSLVFYQIGAAPETDNQTFYVNTFTPTGARVTGSLVTIKENGTATTFTKTTSAAGVAQFQLKHTTLYTITASKSGYTGASTSLTTNTGMSDSISLILTPVTTTTVIPTGSWTVSPSYTPTGNMTGFWTPWVNLFSQMGAANAELPLLIAALIIVMCMILGAGVAGVLGAEVMMGFGAIFCVALGLIPIWVVLAIIVLGFLFYGLKVSK